MTRDRGALMAMKVQMKIYLYIGLQLDGYKMSYKGGGYSGG